MSLKVENLDFSYKDNHVLKDISFEAEEGEFLSILGPNGVGKSTLFRCILKLLEPQGGQIFINGKSMQPMTPDETAKQIAYIPQFHSPVFNYSVLDMVLMGTTSQIGTFAVPKEKQIKTAEAALEMLNIMFLRDRGYQSISGGERQMTLIARAIAQQAKILVMDEPSASLDFGNRIRLMNTVRGLTKAGYTVIQSTHDPEQAYRYSDKVLAIKDGRVAAFGKPEDVITSDVISALYGLDVEIIKVKENIISCV